MIAAPSEVLHNFAIDEVFERCKPLKSKKIEKRVGPFEGVCHNHKPTVRKLFIPGASARPAHEPRERSATWPGALPRSRVARESEYGVWGRSPQIKYGEMSEWLKEHAWKACVGETLPWVRIPLSPPFLAHPTQET